MAKKKMNPNSLANIQGSREELAERGRKGGQTTVKIKRELRTFRELDAENTTDEERLEMLKGLKKRAKYSNAAFELYRDTMGMKPSNKVEVGSLEAEKQKLDDIIKQIGSDG